FAPLVAGPVATLLVLESDDPDDPQLAIALDGTGVHPPAIQLSPTSLIESLVEGGTVDRTLTIANTGLGELTWSLTVQDGVLAAASPVSTLGGPSWVSVSSLSGTVPPGLSTDLTVTFTAYLLFPGDYSATIVVGSNDPDESVISVPLHLHVIGIPRIE